MNTESSDSLLLVDKSTRLVHPCYIYTHFGTVAVEVLPYLRSDACVPHDKTVFLYTSLAKLAEDWEIVPNGEEEIE